MKVIETKDGLILEVLVRPRSRAFRLVAEGDEIVVFCREEPAKGRANKEIINEFSKLFHRRVEIISGFSSRHKKLLIWGAKSGDVDSVLQGLRV